MKSATVHLLSPRRGERIEVRGADGNWPPSPRPSPAGGGRGGIPEHSPKNGVRTHMNRLLVYWLLPLIVCLWSSRSFGFVFESAVVSRVDTKSATIEWTTDVKTRDRKSTRLNSSHSSI